jgi:hypothetical protein
MCFSKKLRNLEAAFAMFAAYYNYCWRTRKPDNTGKRRPTAAMMAKLTDHSRGFDKLFDAVLRPATHSWATTPSCLPLPNGGGGGILWRFAG